MELCKDVSALREELLRAGVELHRPGYHLDLEPSSAFKTTEFLHSLPGKVLELQRRIAKHRQSTGREDFDDILVLLGALRRDPTFIFRFSGRNLHEALSLPDELLAAAVVEDEPLFKMSC